jgi:hypothetical protein
VLFVAIFYGIQIIWEREAGVLAKLMVTPTPRAALITGKAFAAGLRSVVQAAVVVVLAAILGVELTHNPLKLLATACVVVLGSAFFSCLSMSIAGVALNRDRLMGIGQAITMPLFFSSNALYPTALMPGWLQAISRVNPLSYEVDALRWLLIGVPPTSGWTWWYSSRRPPPASSSPPPSSPAWPSNTICAVRCGCQNAHNAPHCQEKGAARVSPPGRRRLLRRGRHGAWSRPRRPRSGR